MSVVAVKVNKTNIEIAADSIVIHGDSKRTDHELIKNPVKKYIMDFAEVSYVNSIGVGAVAAALKKAKKLQGNIKFINVSSTVMELFELTRLTKVFEIYESEEEALKSYETVPVK